MIQRDTAANNIRGMKPLEGDVVLVIPATQEPIGRAALVDFLLGGSNWSRAEKASADASGDFLLDASDATK